MSKALEKLKSTMLELGIEPKKSLGQNFLISDHVIEKIIQKVKSIDADLLLEIGPGLGALTHHLQGHFQQFWLIELDKIFVTYWQQKGLRVFESDALQWNWREIPKNQKVTLVSNLPYQISSSLVIDRSLDPLPLQLMVLMFQKEVAQRIKAVFNSENYGILSVIAQEFWSIENLLEAGPGDFLPPPKVASRVLVFTPRKSEIEDRNRYLKFIKACFLHRRKLMASNLKEGYSSKADKIEEAFIKLKLNPKVRAQELKLKQFVDLYHELG